MSKGKTANRGQEKLPFPPSGCKARYSWMGNGWTTRQMRRAKGGK